MTSYTQNTSWFREAGDLYEVVEPITWHIGHETGPTYTVPSGFTFNVSVPRWLWWLFDPHERAYLKAAALHDHMLVAGWDRISAASQFHNALKADKVRLWRRLAMFLAVSLYRYE